METVMGAETRERRWRLDNAGELHQKQPRDLQARVCSSRTATLANRVLPRVTGIRTIRVRRRVQGRQRVGSDIFMVRNPIPTTTPTETRRSLPLLQSGHDRPPPRTRNANGERTRAAQLLDDRQHRSTTFSHLLWLLFFFRLI